MPTQTATPTRIEGLNKETLFARFEECVNQYGLEATWFAINAAPLLSLADHPTLLDSAVKTALDGERGIFVVTCPGDGTPPRFNNYAGDDIDVQVMMHIGDHAHNGERVSGRA